MRLGQVRGNVLTANVTERPNFGHYIKVLVGAVLGDCDV